MGTLYLVRHGQASFGAANYDQLSPLGHQQCLRLGQYLRGKGQRFEAVITGTLQRHHQSYAAIADGLQVQAQPVLWPGLNEYDSHAVIAAVHPAPLAKADTAEQYKHHFRLLRQGLKAWMTGTAQPAGMPSHRDFVAGVAAALDHVLTSYQGDVLMVSSGGPISTALCHIMGSPAEVMIDLNMRLRNSAITEFAYTPKRHMLAAYNALPHLEGEAYQSWITYT